MYVDRCMCGKQKHNMGLSLLGTYVLMICDGQSMYIGGNSMRIGLISLGGAADTLAMG
jgi:hypothetical protein